MPFFINQNFGYFCIANEYKQYQNVNYMPWKLVSGNLEEYNEIEFLHEPKSPFHVHCSPIFINDILSLSYNSKVYKKNNDNSWEIMKENLWQGFFDGEFTNYVFSNKAIIKDKEMFFPFFEKVYRIAPFNDMYIITGQSSLNIFSVVINKDGDILGEIQDSFGNSIYKCNIAENVLYHSVKKFKEGVWHSENYEIQKTTDFLINENTRLKTNKLTN
jgi:hypothetical protein